MEPTGVRSQWETLDRTPVNHQPKMLHFFLLLPCCGCGNSLPVLSLAPLPLGPWYTPFVTYVSQRTEGLARPPTTSVPATKVRGRLWR